MIRQLNKICNKCYEIPCVNTKDLSIQYRVTQLVRKLFVETVVHTLIDKAIYDSKEVHQLSTTKVRQS